MFFSSGYAKVVQSDTGEPGPEAAAIDDEEFQVAAVTQDGRKIVRFAEDANAAAWHARRGRSSVVGSLRAPCRARATSPTCFWFTVTQVAGPIWDLAMQSRLKWGKVVPMLPPNYHEGLGGPPRDAGSLAQEYVRPWNYACSVRARH